ncbi:MAG: hypothetical protein ACE5HA_00835 [Anaerolineae bacterium]
MYLPLSHFPMENPIFQFFYWLVNTAGVGGLAVGLLVTFAVISVGGALRWIVRGAQATDPEDYAYPTPALHEHT